jgi:hypothetical protein
MRSVLYSIPGRYQWSRDEHKSYSRRVYAAWGGFDQEEVRTVALIGLGFLKFE